MTIALLIDSDPRVIDELALALRPTGLSAQVAPADGDIVATVAAASPGVILLRVELRNQSGFAVCNRLRRAPETRAIPLILYGALSKAITDQHAKLKTRADGYLSLPVVPSELQALLLEVLP